MNCGETREIAARGRCFRCYRAYERDRNAVASERHTPALRKEHTKLLNGLTKVMSGLQALGVGGADVQAIRSLLSPYLEPVAHLLDSRVNSEHLHTNTFTIEANVLEEPASMALVLREQ
jgi:hypothetical protein